MRERRKELRTEKTGITGKEEDAKVSSQEQKASKPAAKVAPKKTAPSPAKAGAKKPAAAGKGKPAGQKGIMSFFAKK